MANTKHQILVPKGYIFDPVGRIKETPYEMQNENEKHDIMRLRRAEKHEITMGQER